MGERDSVKLVQLYRDFDERCATCLDQIKSTRRYEKQLYVPSEETRKKAERALQELLAEASELEAPDVVFEILKNHFDEFIREQMSHLRRMFAGPSSFISGISNTIDYYSRKDSRSSSERAEILLSRLNNIDAVWSGVRKLLPSTAIDEVSQMSDVCDTLSTVAKKMVSRVPELYSGMSEKLVQEVQSELERVSERAKGWDCLLYTSRCNIPLAQSVRSIGTIRRILTFPVCHIALFSWERRVVSFG